MSRCRACMEPVRPGTTVCPRCGAQIPCKPNSANSLQPGYELGRFVIGREIGRGGFGITYIAFDKRLETVRCIKEYFPGGCKRREDMSPDYQEGEEARFRQFSERFLKEARIMSAMSDRNVPNVVQVFDQLDLNGTTYIIMEYLNGCTLDQHITRRKQGLDWTEAKRVMEAVLETVGEIHKQGYLHRDLSLNNIFRLKDGSIRVIDFGSAELLSDALSGSENIWPSSKPYYSPPEQA